MTEEARTLYQVNSAAGLDALMTVLSQRGYDVIGPTLRDKAIMLAKISSSKDLPRGVRDEQEKGSYRVKQTSDAGFFGYNLGPSSWKSYLFPEKRRLWQLKRNGNPEVEEGNIKPLAFFGVRACELAAIKVQDRTFLRDQGDPDYKRRRNNVFIVGVHCRTTAQTCFCPSMGTGPEFGESDWDLLLTEDNERLLIEAGSAEGTAILATLPFQTIAQDGRIIIEQQLAQTRKSISREMNQTNIKEQIYASVTGHNWDQVGARCLACANCTLVCPTCFCSTVEDVSDVEGATAERWQKWDSCFHLDFSYVHGGSRRVSTASRYRQWFTHKLATWHDQFGTSGCVGCGRCIAWCPVGIDITEEMATIRAETDLKSEKNR